MPKFYSMKNIIRDAVDLAFGPAAVVVCLLGGDPDKLRDLINDPPQSESFKYNNKM